MAKTWIVALLLLLVLPLAGTVAAESGDVITSGTHILYDDSAVNVTSIKATFNFTSFQMPNTEYIHLSADTLNTSITHKNWDWWNSHRVEIENGVTDIVVLNPQRVVIIYNLYSAGTLANRTIYVYSDWIWGMSQREDWTQTGITVSDDDLAVLLSDQVDENNTILTSWEILISDTEQYNVEEDGTLTDENWSLVDQITEFASTVFGYVALMQSILGYMLQLLPYVPLVAAFWFADAFLTGLFTGNWSPVGNLVKSVVEVTVALVTAIASLIGAVNPF